MQASSVDPILDLLCTVGRGMSRFAVNELSALPAQDIKVLNGKILFRAKLSVVPLLKEAKMVERCFLSLFFKETVLPEDDSSLSTFIVDVLSSADWSVFHCHKQVLLDADCLRSTGDKGEINLSKLYVKLRPKRLIRYTDEVYRSVLPLLEENLDLKTSGTLGHEVNLMLSEDVIFLGIPLTKNRLSERAYITRTGLRSTSAAAVVNFIEDGIVLDPMCGRGSLLCESAIRKTLVARRLPDIDNNPPLFHYLIGCDVSSEQLDFSRENLLSLQSKSFSPLFAWDLVLSSVQNSPFRDNVIDQLVCDLPFGKKFVVPGTHEGGGGLARFYKRWITGMERILRIGGRFSLLVTSRLHNHAYMALNSIHFSVEQQCTLKLGTTTAVILAGCHKDHS